MSSTITRRATAGTPGEASHAPALREVTAEPADLDGRGIRHSEAIRELAFACWLDAHGNADRAQRLLVDLCKRDTTSELPTDESGYPSANAIRRWAKRDGWEVQYVEAAGTGYSHRLKLSAARFVALQEQAIDVLDTVTSPGYVPTQYDKVRVDAAKHATSMMAPVMEKLAVAAALASYERQAAAVPEYTSAAEANKFWIKGGRSSD